MADAFNENAKLNFIFTSKGEDKLVTISQRLDEVERSFRNLKNTMASIDGTIDRNTKTMEKNINRVSAASQKLGKDAKKTGKDVADGFTIAGENVAKLAQKILLFVGLTGPIIKITGYVIDLAKSVGEFEDALTRVATVTRPQMVSLGSAINDIGRQALITSGTVRATFSEITVAAYAAGSAGLSFEQQLAAIQPTAALVNGTLGEMEFTAKFLAGAFNVFSERLQGTTNDFEKFQAIADITADVFSRQQIELSELEKGMRLAASASGLMDIQFNELVGTLGFLNTGMLKGSRAGTSLLNSMLQIAQKSGALKDRFGIAFDPKKPLNFVDVMRQLNARIGNTEISAETLATLFEIFGKRGGRAVAAILADFNRFEESIKRGVDDTRNMAEVLSFLRNQSVVGQFKLMTNELGALLVTMNELIPVTDILQGAFYLLGKSAQGWTKIFAGLNYVLGGAGGTLADNFRTNFQDLKLELLEAQFERLTGKSASLYNTWRELSSVDAINPGNADKLKEVTNEIDKQRKIIAKLKGFEGETERDRLLIQLVNAQEELDKLKKSMSGVRSVSVGMFGDMTTVSVDMQIRKKKAEIESLSESIKKLSEKTKAQPTDPAKIFDIPALDTSISDKLKTAFDEGNKILIQSNLMLQANGKILAAQEDINSAIRKANRFLADYKKEKITEIDLTGKSADEQERILKTLQQQVMLAEAVSLGPETAAKIITETVKLAGQRLELMEQNRKAEESLNLEASMGADIAKSTASGLAQELVMRQQIVKSQTEFINSLRNGTTLDQVRRKEGESLESMTKRLISLAGEDVNSKKLINKIIQESIGLESLLIRQAETLNQKGFERRINLLRTENQIKSEIAKLEGKTSAEQLLLQGRLLQNQINEVSARRDSIKSVKGENAEYMSLNDQVKNLKLELTKINLTREKLVPIQEKLKNQLKEYSDIQGVISATAETNVGRAEMLLQFYQSLRTSAASNSDAEMLMNNLREKGVTLQTLQRDLYIEQVRRAADVGKAIKQNIRDNLFEALIEGKRFEETLGGIASAIGDVVLEQQFNNVIDQILAMTGTSANSLNDTFNQGANTVVEKMQTELPPLFSYLGDILVGKFEGMSLPKPEDSLPLPQLPDMTGLQNQRDQIGGFNPDTLKQVQEVMASTQGSAVDFQHSLEALRKSAELDPGTIDKYVDLARNLDKSGVSADQLGAKAPGIFDNIIATFQKNLGSENLFGNALGGAFAGFSGAKQGGYNESGQFAGAIGGLIGNALLPGVGGVVGGLLSSSLFGKREEKPQAKEQLFRLDQSNSLLSDINRNLVAIREDNSAFALQTSFFFSQSNSNPLSGGDTYIIENVNAGAGSVNYSPNGSFEAFGSDFKEQVSRGVNG